ncbi:MAG: SusE domain-containing protein [Bacteroidetes bacterium]|nr:SusE domain-containing protein [Bacteroidota bacterium]
MKKIAIFLITILGVAFITSCKKDEVKAFLSTSPTAPAITAGLSNGATVVLDKANKDAAINVTWNAATYGFKASVTYTLQMDKKGNNFASAVSLGSPASTILNSTYTLAMVTNDLNNKLLTLQADPENPQPTAVEFRVKAWINDSVKTAYSPVISATYTPYFIPIIYAKVYVPGGYQSASGYTSDWSPDKAPFLASLSGDGKYEGYVNFATTGEYKITSQADWNGTNWGGGAAAGTLSATGGNLVMAAAGYYKVNVNTNESTISLTKTTWGVIGSATANGWNGDQNMTYNPTTKVWTVTTDLIVGEIKFRANAGWDLNYGIGASAGKLSAGGPNIPVTVAGNYTITLDFSVPPIYRYKLVKN